MLEPRNPTDCSGEIRIRVNRVHNAARSVRRFVE
jgi:hypothetical protein